MMKWIFLGVFFLLHGNPNAQVSPVNIPADKSISTLAIATYINNNFKSEKDRINAIYNWVTSNLKYSTDSANNINLGIDPGAKITAALRRRKGVCENFAAIFNDICAKAGITSFVIDGYTKQNGTVDKVGHAWCAVFLDKEWQLCDPTWDVGGNVKWYLVPPSEMIISHMPFDPMWQLLEHPVSPGQFYEGWFGNKKQTYFNYKDTIAAYIEMDSLQRFRSTAFRIEQNGLYNNLVKNRQQYTKMNIEIIREDKDVDLYNAAVTNLNSATIIYNDFVNYRNRQFTPLINDKAMAVLLDGVDTKLRQAHSELDEIERSAAVFKFSTDEVRSKLNRLSGKVKDQYDFLKVYLATDKISRNTLFYKRQGIVGK